MTLQGEIVGGGEPGGSGANDCHLLAGLCDGWNGKLVDVHAIGDEHFELANGDRLIELPAVAGVLTRGVADSAAYGRQGIDVPIHLVRFPELTLGDEFDVTEDVGMNRACRHTRGFT